MRRLTIICLTIVGVVLIGIQPMPAALAQEAYRHLEQGNVYHKKGQYKEAVREYKIAWEEGKILDACFNLALTYDRDLNENQLAVKYYNAFLSADSLAPEAQDIREMADKARNEVKKSTWWFDKQKSKRIKQEKLAMLDVANKYREKDALALDKDREEDSLPALSHVCFGCHAGSMGPQINMATTHPVGRVPTGKLAKTVPKYVRFYKEGQVVCLSCHSQENLHFEMGTPGINYKYLRVDTQGGEDMSRFCAFCHSSKSARRFLEDDDDEGELRRDGGALELRR